MNTTTEEIIGYVGGLVLAVALFPQVVHSFRTKSTSDISYGWQLTYLTGLMLNLVYFILIRATAAWATLTIEIGFAITLLLMKIRFDGFRSKVASLDKQSIDDGDADDIEKQVSSTVNTDTVGSETKAGVVDLNAPINGIKYGEAIQIAKRNSVGESVLVQEAFRGFHIMIDALFEVDLPADFGVILMTEMCRLAKVHGVRVVHHHVETFDGTESPPGFAGAALLDESHMSAHCYSDQGKIAFDVFTCGSKPDNTRKVARDVMLYLQNHLGDEAKFYVHHLPRFPKQMNQQR